MPSLFLKFLPAFALTACLACSSTSTTTSTADDVAGDTKVTADVSHGPKSTTGIVTNERIIYTDGLHNENTDLITWQGKTWLMFRGGETGQVGTPVARLKIYQSVDLGDTVTMTAEIFMPERDIRDPKFLIQGDKLVIYAISRIPGGHLRDEGGLAWTVRTESSDGIHWTPPVKVYDEKWGFWRFTEHGGLTYATAYNDGDTQVAFLSSADGLTWKPISLIYDSKPDVPSEAELQFFGDTAVSLVRLDNGASLLDEGHTAVCVAPPPYATWDCTRKFDKRLDGPKWFVWSNRQFIMARKHLPDGRKRTALYEIHGDLANPQATVTLQELAEFKSAGDTAYVGVLPMGGSQFLVSWYSSDVVADDVWSIGMFTPSDIWLAWVDLAFAPAPQ